MIVEEIVNEIDKFITKYKALKSDNQTLTRFKSDVKTALNNKGIISTNADEDVVQSITNYTPPSGSVGLDAEYLKNVGLLPYMFSGTPTERDLLVNRFLFQDPNNQHKFFSTEYLSSVVVKLDGSVTDDFLLNRTNTTSDDSSIDRNKYTITNSGYYVNEFSFNKSGNYSISLSDGTLSLDKTINYVVEEITSLGDFLLYAVNLKSRRNVCYDTKKIETLNNLDASSLDGNASSRFSSIVGNLNSMGSSPEKLGYVYNLRTGKAHLVDVVWQQGGRSVTNDSYKELTTLIHDDKIKLVTNNYAFMLMVHGSSYDTFIIDIDYQDGDTLVFAFNPSFYPPQGDSHKYNTTSVANYLKTIATALSSDAHLDADLSGVTKNNYEEKLGSVISSDEMAGTHLGGDMGDIIDSIDVEITKYQHGIRFAFKQLVFKVDAFSRHDAVEFLLHGLVNSGEFDKGFKSIVILDFTGMSNSVAINKEINFGSIFDAVGYLVIKVNKSQVYSIVNGKAVSGKYDSIVFTNVHSINGRYPCIKINGSDFYNGSSSDLEYTFYNDHLGSLNHL
jgi:hypothetical protein